MSLLYHGFVNRGIFSRAARLLAFAVLCLQVFLPGAMALASGEEGAARYLCLPYKTEISAAAEQAERTIAALFGEDEKQTPPTNNGAVHDCPFCTLTAAALSPVLMRFSAPAAYNLRADFVRENPALVKTPQGPPLGSRGPPSHS